MIADTAAGVNVPQVRVFALAPGGREVPCHWEAVERRRRVWTHQYKCIRNTWHWEHIGWRKGELLSLAGPISRMVPIRIYYDDEEDEDNQWKAMAEEYYRRLTKQGFRNVEIRHPETTPGRKAKAKA